MPEPTGRPKVSENIAGKVPPSEASAEEYILAAALAFPGMIDDVPDLSPDHFYLEKNQKVWEAMRSLKDAGTVPDPVSVLVWLKDNNKLSAEVNSTHLGHLSALPTHVNIRHYADIVLARWRQRQIINICRVSAAEAFQPQTDVQAFVEGVEKQISDLAHQNSRTTLVSIGDIYETAFRKINDAFNGGSITAGTPTGWTGIDEQTGGWFEGDLVVVAGRPGTGKSSFAANALVNVARGSNGENAAAFFSLEMPSEQVAVRLACAGARVDMGKVRFNRIDSRELARLVHQVAEMKRLPIWIDETPAISILELRSRVRALTRGIDNGRSKSTAKRLKLVVVDYIQLMKGTRLKGDSHEQEVSTITKSLKELAKSEHVTIMALSQMNRSIEKEKNRRPQLSDLRSSGAIEQDADAVFFLYRPNGGDSGEDGDDVGGAYDPDRVELIVAKQRNGPTGTIELRWNGSTTTFSDYDGRNAPSGSYAGTSEGWTTVRSGGRVTYGGNDGFDIPDGFE
jgi:replicative DNA helicase